MSLETDLKGKAEEIEPADSIYPWLTSEEWLGQIPPEDTANIRIYSGLLYYLLRNELARRKVAYLYVDGQDAVPKSAGIVRPSEIDLRLVFTKGEAPTNLAEFEALQTKVKKQYNTTRIHDNTKAILGPMEDAANKEEAIYQRIAPRRGRPINLLLPNDWRHGYNSSVDEFEDYHRQNLDNLHTDLDALRRNLGERSEEYEGRRTELLSDAYIVRLIPPVSIPISPQI